MEYIHRKIEQDILKHLFQRKAVLIYGPRQAGKSTLMREIVQRYESSDVLWLDGDNPSHNTYLQEMTIAKWQSLIGRKKVVVIDEAQSIPNIGRSLKLAVDYFNDVQILASGSSSFALKNKTSDPMTGRKFEYTLLPLSFEELCDERNFLEEADRLHFRLRYGMYPDVIMNEDDAERRIGEISGSYLYRDVFGLEGVKSPKLFKKIVKALAFQIGSEVSFTEIALLVGADRKTVEKYVSLLEQSFVVFELNAYSNNHRNEIKKSKKIYFYDLGIRNAAIGNFLPLESRTDAGALWENYLVLERMKHNLARFAFPGSYFWRNTNQNEVDYIEETASDLKAYEFKWSPKKKRITPPIAFARNYPHASFQIITPENFESFLCND